MTRRRDSGTPPPVSTSTRFIVLRLDPDDTLRAAARPQQYLDAATACAEAQTRAAKSGGSFLVMQSFGGVFAPIRKEA